MQKLTNLSKEELIELIVREREAFSGWQPIESAPKDYESRVLATNGFSVVTVYWSGACWINERAAIATPYKATHWQPLPEPPMEA